MAKPTLYSLNIRYRNTYFCIAKISINNSGGDIYYIPATHSENEKDKNLIDHISFHKDGRVHITNRDNSKSILQPGANKTGGRQEIVTTGYQILLTQTISDFTKLPRLNLKDIGLIDEVFNVTEIIPLKLKFSMISGKLIVRGKATAHSARERPEIIEVKKDPETSSG